MAHFEKTMPSCLKIGKLVCVAALAGLALALQLCIWTLEHHLESFPRSATPSRTTSAASDDLPAAWAHTGSSRRTVAEAYWRQALYWLPDDDSLQPGDRSGKHNPQRGREALHLAAENGHPEAQFHVGAHGEESLLHWRFAAQSGHVPSTLALAHRLEPGSTCEAQLPYWQAAADGVLDQLEASPLRAKIPPPMDHHYLYATKSSSSKDETDDALQYYHHQQSPQSLHTLAHLYQYGLRGVSQNVTLALRYYTQAALTGHWEAAGQAGKMHLWGMGTPPDLVQAHKLFRLGLPEGLEGCKRRYQDKIQNKPNSHPCDSACLNGMGLLRLMGVPMIVGIDRDLALGLLELAKQQGSMDAAYHLAMMRLGWKTHFRSIHELPDGQQSAQSVMGISNAAHQPTPSEYQAILTDLLAAAGKNHIQAKHRIGSMYVNGITTPDGKSVLAPSCDKAMKEFQWVARHASLDLSSRLRRAYQQYQAGDTANSVRNYRVAAEMGSELAQVNAAYLMERGECLDMDRMDCARASLRLWKKAASSGNAEASLRVGDFYYYGKLRDAHEAPVGPFGWTQYILFPDRWLPRLVESLQDMWMSSTSDKGTTGESGETCVAAPDEEGGTCAVPMLDEPSPYNSLEEDLAMAAQYYKLSVDETSSPRAHFNLGFLYEYGLGVTQDFPLAKRHYDLAISTRANAHEAQIPVTIALWSMKVHEFWVKSFQNTAHRGISEILSDLKALLPSSIGDTPELLEADSNPQSSPRRDDLAGLTRQDVILGHLFSWESLLILALTILITVLVLRRS